MIKFKNVFKRGTNLKFNGITHFLNIFEFQSSSSSRHTSHYSSVSLQSHSTKKTHPNSLTCKKQKINRCDCIY